jgi:His-Xaa-Ser repeat protein HxsA
MPGVEAPPPADLTAKGVRTPDALRMLVMRVQAALLLKNYDPGQVDGVMGPATIAALKKYQKDLGLKVTGSINAQTLDALALRSSF